MPIVNPYLKAQLKAKGEKLRASHDDAVISGVIGDLDDMSEEGTSEAADLLRFMIETDD